MGRYSCYIIFLIYNVLIAILVDGYEEAKDLVQLKLQEQVEEHTSVQKITDTFTTMITKNLLVPANTKSNTCYIKVPGHKVYSCGNKPVGTPSMTDYAFKVSVVEPWHGILKNESFVYLVKVERTSAPKDRNKDGWPADFTLQALIRLQPHRMEKDWLEHVKFWLSANYTALLKMWRNLVALTRRTRTNEERWARNGIDFLDASLSEYMNTQIKMHASNLSVDGTLEEEEAAELSRYTHAIPCDLQATHAFVSAQILDLRRERKQLQQFGRQRADPTLPERNRELCHRLQRLKAIESLAATKMSFGDLVDALTAGRQNTQTGGDAGYSSPCCPDHLIQMLWQVFSSLDDESDADLSGPPSTWRQMEILEDKIDALSNMDNPPDVDTETKPALATSIQTILEAVERMDKRLELVSARVDQIQQPYEPENGSARRPMPSAPTQSRPVQTTAGEHAQFELRNANYKSDCVCVAVVKSGPAQRHGTPPIGVHGGGTRESRPRNNGIGRSPREVTLDEKSSLLTTL